MIFSKIFKGVHLFKTAFNTTRHQIWVSVRLLIVITFFFAFLMWLGERKQELRYQFPGRPCMDFLKYVENPAVVTISPVTLYGQIMGTLAGVLEYTSRRKNIY